MACIKDQNIMIRNKITFAFAITFGFVSFVCAFDMSIGAGVSLGSNFGGGYKVDFSSEASIFPPTKWTTWRAFSSPYQGGGFNAFFDVKYAEFFVGCVFVAGTWEVETSNAGITKSEISATILNYGFLGKYPIPLSKTVSLFPSAGIDIERWIAGDAINNPFVFNIDELGRVWFKFGLGVDLDLSKKIYFRSVLFYGFAGANTFESQTVNDLKEFINGFNITNLRAEEKRIHGFSVKAGIGYRL